MSIDILKKCIYISVIILFISVNINILNTSGMSLSVNRVKTLGDVSVGLVKAKKLYDDGKVVFIDAREEYLFKKAHIKKAFSLPANEFDKNYEILKMVVPNNKEVLIYCNSTCCSTSYAVYTQLKIRGFKNIYVFDGGWGKWIGSKFPIDYEEIKKK
ncbi:MAG: rhodanese-like domain-containing protein [Candidatus Firestonebacteria bacterium]